MKNENDGTEIVPNAELQLIIKANALPDDLGNVIQEKFSGAFAQLDEWKTKADSIVITSEDQVAEIALANDGRKTLMKIRTTLEKTRVELKAPYLNMGRAIDAVCKSLTERIAPIEEDLKTKAEFAARLAEERKARLVAERRAALIEVGHSGDMPALGEMEESTFQMLLVGAKAQAQQVKEQAEREAAEKDAQDRLQATKRQLISLGATENEDGSIVLGDAVFAGFESGIDQETADLTWKQFEFEKGRLANRERIGQSRRLELVQLGGKIHGGTFNTYNLGDVMVQDSRLFDMIDSEWADCLADFTNEAQRIADERAEQVKIKERLADRVKSLISIGAKEYRDNDIAGYRLGSVTITEHNVYLSTDESWSDAIVRFEEEAQRIANEEAEKTARKDRFQARTKTLIALGAKEITDGENDRLELGNSKVMMDALYSLNEDDQRWTFALQSFQDEAERLKQIESERWAFVQRAADRAIQLVQLGAKLDHSPFPFYELGDASTKGSDDDLGGHTDEQWGWIVDEFTKERDCLAKIESDKLLAQQERLQVANDRLAALRDVGFATTFDAVADLTDVEFDALLKVKTTEHNGRKAAQERADRGRTRQVLALAVGEDRSWEFLTDLAADEWESFYANAKRLKDQADQDRANEAAQAAIEAQRKVDEAAKLKAEEAARKKAESATDKEKLEEVVRQIQSIVMPTCTSIQGDAIARGAIERLGKLVGHMHEAMDKM